MYLVNQDELGLIIQSVYTLKYLLQEILRTITGFLVNAREQIS